MVLALLIGTAAIAHHATVVNGYGNSFIFDEQGVTFSVYPDGEFDFYIEPVVTGVCINSPVGGYSFNSGYDYSPYVQYDDYGAVIQVENVPIYYDYYGRVTQIGNVDVHYRNRRVQRVGGLVAFYNSYGVYTHCSGFVNVWNPYYVYRPFYVHFARPAVGFCFVSFNPYRRYYTPIRHTYYRPYVAHARPHYGVVGHTYTPSGHVVSTYYKQSPRRGEVAYSRGHRKMTKEVAARSTARANHVSSERELAYRNNATSARQTSTRGTTTRNSNVRNTNSRSATTRNTTSTRANSPAATTTRNNSSARTNSRNSSSTMSRGTSNSRAGKAPARTQTSSRSSKPASNSVNRGSSSSRGSGSRGSSTSRTPSRSNSSASTSRGSSRSSSNKVGSGGRSSNRSSTSSSRGSSSSRSSASKPSSRSNSSRATSSRGSSSSRSSASKPSSRSSKGGSRTTSSKGSSRSSKRVQTKGRR